MRRQNMHGNHKRGWALAAVLGVAALAGSQNIRPITAASVHTVSPFRAEAVTAVRWPSAEMRAGLPTVQTADGRRAYTQCLAVEATAYSGGGLTASGEAVGVGRIAVDPRVIPLGTELYITAADGASWVYGTAVAADTGGAIKGSRIDLYFSSEGECERFGRRGARVYLLE